MASYQINQHLSLMIPRVFPQWTNEQHIMDVFHKQDIGKVYKVTIVRTPDERGRHYPIYQAFIHFSVWYDNEIAYHFQQRIYNSEKKQTKVVYDDPWFWVVFENKSKNHSLRKEEIRLMQMEFQLYKAEKRMDEQDQCIQQLQECVLLTTTAMNDSIEAKCADLMTTTAIDKSHPYPARPKSNWYECAACDVMTCCEYNN
jgi:hypothetical protein